ncbi:MAG: glycosyltransferase family 39 protein [Planctomycetales bacterium]|nr:glycosyltransferase family 39 protein [Planctomycetales bacterium]
MIDRSSLRRALLPGLILLLAFILRAWQLHGTGYTSDEVAELLLTRKPIASMLLDEDDDLFPPLYRPTVAIWIRLWRTELAARWLNVVYGVGAVAVVLAAGRELLGKRLGWWPALFLACAPFHIHYCREGRAYALYALFAAMMFWGALRVLNHNRRGDWILLTLSSAAAVWTHYYAGPLAVVVWAVLADREIRAGRWRALLTATAALGLLLAPTPILLHRAMADHPDESLPASFDVEALGYMYAMQALGYTVGPSMKDLRSMSAAEGIRQFLPWLAVVALTWAVLGWSAVCAIGRRRAFWLLALPTVLLIPALGYGGNLAGVGFFYRYAAWLPIPYALLIGAGASRSVKNWLVSCAAATLIAVNLLAFYNRLYDPAYAEEDFRAVATKLDELAEPGESVVVASHYMGQALHYYTGDSRPLASFPIFVQFEDVRQREIAEFLDTLQPGERYWIVSQWLPKDDVRRETRDAALQRLGAVLRAELNQTEIYEATR